MGRTREQAAAYYKAYSAEMKAQIIDRRRERVSGWPRGTFAAAVVAQGGLCAICGQKKRLVADHDHSNMRPRAAICQHCNARVGFEESSPLRAKVQEYIASWKEKHGQT